MKILNSIVVLVLTALVPVAAQRLQIQKKREPVGDSIEKAIKRSSLTQPGAKPFHIHMEVTEQKPTERSVHGFVDETWLSPSLWTRTVQTTGLTQTVTQDASGLHYETQGTFMPGWLRNFASAIHEPIAHADRYSKTPHFVEWMVLPNGVESEHCAHDEFMLGEATHQQINFANVCFKDGLISMSQSSDDTVSYADYQTFQKLKVARTWGTDGERPREHMVAKVTVLEAPSLTTLPSAPATATTRDPLQSPIVLTKSLLALAGGTPILKWPEPIPGRGEFTVWLRLDKAGLVREAHPLNSDESGIAAEMSTQFVGQQWKRAILEQEPSAVEGAIVVSYPPVP